MCVNLDKKRNKRKWRVAYRLPGEIKLRSKYFFSNRQAKEFAKKQEELIDAMRGGLKISAIETRLDDYILKFWERYQTKRSYNGARHLYQKHIWPIFGGSILSQIGPNQIANFRDRLLSQGLSSQSVVHALNLLSSIFREAILDGIAETNPTRAVQKPKIIRRHIPRILTDQEINLVLETCDKRILPVILLGLNCGLRKTEILNCRIEDFNFKSNILSVDNRPELGERTKSGRLRLVPTPPAIVELVMNLAKVKGKVFEFSAMTLRRLWTRLMIQTGLKDITLHSLRHTWASKHIEAGTSLEDLRSIGGWAEIKTLQRYAHHRPDYLNHIRGRVNIGQKSAQDLRKIETKVVQFKPKQA